MTESELTRLKEDQDFAYIEMMQKIKKEKEEAESRAKEEALKKEEEAKKQLSIQALWQQFQAFKLEGPNAINFVFRMPNTQKIEQVFDRNDSIQRMYDFVSCCPNSGMEIGTRNFEITQAFPRVFLDPKKRISDVFGTSDAELVNVFEL